MEKVFITLGVIFAVIILWVLYQRDKAKNMYIGACIANAGTQESCLKEWNNASSSVPIYNPRKIPKYQNKDVILVT